MTNVERNFKWGDQEIAPNDIPVENLFALAQQGLNHKRGNEVSAARVAWLKTEDGQTADEAAINAWVAAKQADMLDKVLSRGKYEGVVLGVRAAPGPRVSGIEAIKRQVAVEFLKAALAAYNTQKGTSVSVPTGEKTIRYMGKDMNRDQLIDAYMRANEAKVVAEAERRQAEQAAGADVGEDLFGE